MDVIGYHRERMETIEKELASLKRKSRIAFAVKIVSFVVAVLILIYYLGDTVWGIYVPVLCVAFYVVVYVWDSRLMERTGRMKEKLTAHENELKALKGDFTAFADGECFVNPEHEYSYDLDIFGKNSLFNRICRTVTGLGNEKLAGLLQKPTDCEQELKERQEAVSEMAGKMDWMVDFFSTEHTESRVREILLSVNDGEKGTGHFLSPLFILIWWVPLGLFWLSLAGTLLGMIPNVVPALLFLFNLIYVGFWSGVRRTLFAESVCLKGEFDKYDVLLRKIRNEHFASVKLKSAKERLFDEKSGADIAFRSISRILSNIELRANFVMYLILEGLFLSDIAMIRKLLLWKRRYLSGIGLWADAIADFDAFVSLGNYAFAHPDNVYPCIADDKTIAVEAEGVFHPFLCRGKAVPNDFLEYKGEMFIVTGANMAGKSTLLRTIGISLVMANAGLPVCASRFVFSLMGLFSNMRTTDDINRDISYFNAELIRLTQLMTYCRNHPHTFIVLDEILRGTNSADKLHGSRMFLEHIMQYPVTGVVATHDLELSKMERAGSPYKNYCFEIDMAEHITYSYKMSRGVARNMNATYLLSRMLRENADEWK